MAPRTTSPKGRTFLEREEGVVLRAYPDVRGVMTIGAGLTAASGVVTPKRGMVITREEADRLLGLALQRNYEPAVRAALPGAGQAEFDGAVSFEWNTGAIGKASWVEAWLKRDWPAVHSGLLKWVKGGGKVLPGLQARREREFRVMRDGIYTPLAADPAPGRKPTSARVALPLTPTELMAVRDGLRTLGYEPGPDPRAIGLMAVVDFQSSHDLTIDGVLGRATLSTLQRNLDARKAILAPAAVAAAGGGEAIGSPVTDAIAVPAWTGWVLVALGLLWLVATAWRYRDVLAARIQNRLPRIAAWLLRS